MTVCEKHRNTPAKGYSPCPGCEVEWLQELLAIAERALADLGVTPSEAKDGVARSKANQKDAERYRWLRKRWGRLDESYAEGGPKITSMRELTDQEVKDGYGYDVDPLSLDRAIDAAMAKENE